MAPRGLAKARDYDYSNVGKMGRRTGITLKEGRRDEHGMEELDGMFSSPEKSPVRFNGVNTGNDTMMGSEGMSMDEGNGPGPTDFLSRSASRRSPFFPPPIARSPRKSGLSGSPRRTPGLRSSPMVQSDHVPSSPSSGRQRRTESARQPLNDRRPNTAPIANGVRQKSRDFDSNTGEFTNDENLPVHEEDEDEDEEEVNDLSTFQADLAEEEVDVHEIDDGDFGDDSGNATPDDNDNDSDNAENDNQSEEASPVQAASLRNKRGRKPAAFASVDVDTTTEERPQSPPKRKRAGRPPKSQSSAKEESESQRPAKKAKTSRPERVQQEPPEPLDPELEKVVENHVKRSGPLKGRSLYILKREEPSTEQTGHTRSGRVSVRPLAYWRNERCVYGDGEADVGQRYPLSTIKEIIRTEELQPEKKGGKKRKSSKKSKGKASHDDESEDEPDEKDKWEADEGVLHGFVKTWDNDKNAVTTEEEVSEIAYSQTGIQVRDVKDSTFKVAKLFSDSYIGSGIVELPPKGVKKPKNSKRMHMMFYVCHGRVQVDINGVQFTAGKGCIFQVPRGNYYSFANTYHKGARLFFSQAFIPTDENASSKATAAEAEADDQNENEHEHEDLGSSDAAPPAKPKGRGRGRAKASSKS